MPRYTNKPATNGLHRKVLVPVLVVLSIVGILAVLEATNTTHFFRHKTAIVHTSGSQDTKGEPISSQSGSKTSASSSANDSSQVGSDKNNIIAPNSAALLVPSSGGLVSNHHPSLSGAPDQKTISSVCTTTPGASCTISFTKDGVTKSPLDAETTDVGGSAYWMWDASRLSVGSWTVTAVATLNGQTKSATDAQDMVINP